MNKKFLIPDDKNFNKGTSKGMELDPKYCDVIVKRMINLDKEIIVKRNGVICEDFKP